MSFSISSSCSSHNLIWILAFRIADAHLWRVFLLVLDTFLAKDLANSSILGLGLGHEKTSYGCSCKDDGSESGSCGLWNRQYHWCYLSTDPSAGCHSTSSWDYCVLPVGTKKTSRGWSCKNDGSKNSDCGNHGKIYQWCYTDDGDWDYCVVSQIAPPTPGQHKKETTSYGCDCKDDGSDYGSCGLWGKSYHWCYLTNTRPSNCMTSAGWDYCVPRGFGSTQTTRGWTCKDDGSDSSKCGNHGKRYQWCYTDNDDWDYCVSQPKPSSWPAFASVTDLQRSSWASYFRAVYGELPGSGYPLHIQDMWMIYDQAISIANVVEIPPSVGSCPTAVAGQRYSLNNRYSPTDVSWVWHQYPYSALPANTWVEVMHQADPFDDEQFGAWLLYTPGSGIFFNTGKTIAFKEHVDAYNHFGITGGNWNDLMSQAAAANGYDSIQFTAHVDHVSYPCDTQNTGVPGLDYMGLEVVAVKLTGTYSCTAEGGAPSVMRAGWEASRSCQCDNHEQFLNCQGVPTVTARLPRSQDLLSAVIT